jgi:hypothetical protein
MPSGTSSSPSHRLDLHQKREWPSKPSTILAIYQPDICFPLRCILCNQSVTGERKDTVINAEQTGIFVWNLATWDTPEVNNITA